MTVWKYYACVKTGKLQQCHFTDGAASASGIRRRCGPSSASPCTLKSCSIGLGFLRGGGCPPVHVFEQHRVSKGERNKVTFCLAVICYCKIQCKSFLLYLAKNWTNQARGFSFCGMNPDQINFYLTFLFHYD